ncbi:MAG: ATP-binding protein [Hydrogenophaga sp.]|uniref:ATP-binding protein n=1 Tax=Hydrogenophaga sp. TaxID=1904254 RepID=UPI003D9BA6ED
MKLQHKAWALVLIVVGLCAGGAMLGARHIVGASFEKIETERAEREGERARRVLNQQVLALAATARDYAFWSDAVDFVQGRKPSFMADNFDVENLGYLRISEVLVFDARGRVLSGVARREGDARLQPVSAERQLSLRPLVTPVLASADPKTVLQTLRVVDGQLELLVVAAVHHPDHAAQGLQGAIAMVRRLDQAELDRLADVLMMPTRLAFDLHGAADQDFHHTVLDEQSEELHAVLRDHQGQPVAELVLQIDRRLHQQGQALAWTGMGLAALAGVLAASLLVLLLDRLLLRRLQGLHADLTRITRQGPNDAAPARGGSDDELGQLADGINGLLARVRQDVQAQQEAHAQQEALQIQLMQSQKTEALGRLTGGIAHDFNNSLAAITGWVRLADEDLDRDHPSSDALQQALKATRYADGLMRQLLAFGRQTPPKLRRLHWTSLIEETRQLVASGLTKSCELVVDYRVDDDEVDADPTQLQQVLVNLLINASDAMQGKGRIELALSALELPLQAGQTLPAGAHELPDGRYLVLSVCDHGPGVPADHLGRVFDPFFTTKGKGRGTGLGLSVAQGIVLRHHGGIGVNNRPEGGACFHIYLPASQRDVAVDPITKPDGGPGQGRHVLFVDDDQLVRHAWSALLERQGWQVTRARDGEEGWAQFSQTEKHFDLVLTDQSMPRLDGVGLARRIREASASTPIILISGHVNEVDACDQQTLFNAVLHKPVDTNDLGRVMQDVLATGSTRY